MSQAILRLPDVKKAIGLSRSTIYLQVARGLFPAPVRISTRAVGWLSDEIDAIRAARIDGKTDDEIRTLVQALEAQSQAKA